MKVFEKFLNDLKGLQSKARKSLKSQPKKNLTFA